ncbi:MAG: right-handed parallel beta-helix repeat-containing protein [Kiritimatiellae bacterium]|nr:right-handed parallel beta-helix repeat-containing protein [Kiritimatiellia bacterium]
MLTLPNGKSFRMWTDRTQYRKVYHVAQQHPAADDDNDGSENRPFLTIRKAAELAGAGEMVLIHEGEYRETVIPHGSGEADDRVLCFKGVDTETVVVTGAEPFEGPYRPSEGWRPRIPTAKEKVFADAGARVFMAKLPRGLFIGVNPFTAVNGPTEPWFGDLAFRPEKPHQRKLANMKRGMIFCDGVRLTQVANYWDLGECAGSFYVEGDGLTVHLRMPLDDDPAGHTIAFTAREQCFCPENPYSGYVKIENITFRMAGNGFPPPQRGAVSTNRGHHYLIENCRFEDANGIGVDIGCQCPARHSNQPRGHHIVRNNVFARCGICGLAGVPGSTDSSHYLDVQHSHIAVIGNRFVDNCWQDFEDLQECAAVKLHHLRDSLIAENTIDTTSYGSGIWTDAACENLAIRENVVVNAKTMWGGIFVEASHENIEVSSNTVVGSKCNGGGGNGIYSHNCDNILNKRNIVLGCEGYGIYHRYGGTDRVYRGRGNTGFGIDFYENIIADCAYAIMQPTDRGHADRNIYGRFSEAGYLKVGLPELHLDLKAWRGYMGWDLNSIEADIDYALGADAATLDLQVRFGEHCLRQAIDLRKPSAAQIESLLARLIQTHGQPERGLEPA